MDINKIKKTDVVILCGGFGMRLKPALPNLPKVLAPIKDKALVDLLLENLLDNGFQRVILTLYHLKEHVKKHNFTVRNKMDLVFSEEEEPLGTGGAIKQVKKFLKSDNFLVMNGDSFCLVDFKNLFQFHDYKKSLTTMVLAGNDREDGGNVLINKHKRIINYKEKNEKHPLSFINAGIYLFNQKVFEHMPDKKTFSLEMELFPSLVGKKFHGFVTPNRVIDIGTPERYTEAIKIL